MTTQNETTKTIIEHFYHWEKVQPTKVFLRQPKGDQWHTITYAEAGQAARKMTTALRSKGLVQGDHIGQQFSIWAKVFKKKININFVG